MQQGCLSCEEGRLLVCDIVAKYENSAVACNVLQVFHVSIPFLGPVLKASVW